MNTQKSCLTTIFLSIVSLFLLTILAIFIGIYLLPNLYDTVQEKSHISTIAKNFFQIVFFITTGVIAILSFYQAKKGLFNPVRTEIFKSQFDTIKEFPKIFGVINSKQDLDSSYSIEYLRMANVFKLFFDYDQVISKQDRSESNANYYRENFFITDKYSLVNEINVPLPFAQKVKIEKWEDYKVEEVLLTNRFIKIQNSLKELITSPLLPDKFKSKLIDLYKRGETLIKEIGDSMEEAKEQIPNIMSSSTNGIYPGSYINLIQIDSDKLYKYYTDCINFISEHLKVNDLID